MSTAFKILLCAILVVNSLALFKNSPDYKFYSSGSPTAIKISSDQSRIIVGYYDGTVRFYDLNGNFKFSATNHRYKIIDIETLSSGYVITLDSNGTAIRWSTSGSYSSTWYLGSSVTDMTVTSSSYDYVAFNLG